MDNRQLTRDIKEALNKKYEFPEWIFLTEVPNATGALSQRQIDGFAYNLYPSKKYQKIAFEIKTLKSDLQHELKNGSKSNAIAKYCDLFYLVVPKGLITEDIEIPVSWGIMEYANGKLRQTKKPSQIESCALSEGFVAGMLQSLERKHKQFLEKEKNCLQKEVGQDYDNRVREAVDNKMREFEWENHNQIEYNKFMNTIKSIDRFSNMQSEVLMKYLLSGMIYKNISNEVMVTANSINQLVDKLKRAEELIKKENVK